LAKATAALMQISPADLTGMLKADVVSLVVGANLVVVGLLTLGLLAAARLRFVPLLWLGVFSLLYGLRLFVRTTTFRLGVDEALIGWDFVAAAITYTIPLPAILFARAMLTTSRRFWTWSVIALTGFAVCAIVSDALLNRPESARTPSNLVVIASVASVVGWLLRPGLTPSRELRAIRVGALCVLLTAAVDHLRGMRLLVVPGPDLEPFGVTVLVACVGTAAIWRLRDEARRLAVIDRELSAARQIQSSILPQTMPRIPGLTAFARYRPMMALAGDFYDLLGMDSERVGILVADASGHGVPAALIASMVKVALAAQSDRAERPAAVLAGMNHSLCGRLAGRYVTAAYMFLDTRSGLIRYAAAGHPPMLHLARRSPEAHAVEQNGLPLGVLEGAGYSEVEMSLQDGDRLLLYTDGLIEAADAEGDFFGLDRLKAALARGSALQSEAAADHMLRTIDTWSGQPQGDDFTIVLVDWKR
jgi:phosphoserine phosphatase RsbU/P